MRFPRLSLATTCICLMLACQAPYRETKKGTLVTETGERLSVVEVTAPKDKLLPIYMEGQLPPDARYEVMEEMSYNAVCRETDPIPTKESQAETLSSEGWKKNANAVILEPIVPASGYRKVPGWIEYRVQAKLVRMNPSPKR